MEREEINEKLSMLGRRMEELKLEIHSATTATAATFSEFEFESSFDITAALSDKVRAISEEMQELSLKVETEVKGQLNISTGEFQSLTRQLEQVTVVMGVLEKLTKAQQLMETIATASSERKYSEASSSLVLLEEALKQPLCEREEEIKIMVAVRIQVEVLKQKLIQDLNDAWKETVFWTSLDGASKKEKPAKGETKGVASQDEDIRQWELRLPKSDSTAEQQTLSEMVTALEEVSQLDRKLQALGRHLVQNIFPLTLYWQKVVVTETPLSSGKQVVVKATSERKLPSCLDVFSVVGNLLDLLNDSLLHVQVERKAGQDAEGCQVTLMNLLGDEIAEKVLDGIVKECLSHAIPSTNKELESFHEVIAVTKKFQDKLVSMGFVSEDSRILLDYVENVNVLFANKKCQSILERARGLMTTDIHDTALISSDASPGELPPLDKAGGPSKEKSRKVEMASDPLLSDSTFRMPTCRVSVCIQELLDLAYSTLNEASSSSPQCAVQMFYAVRNIFELFCSVFPTYHAHSLANFPQLTALHHNNCMFLAHHLLTLGHQFKHSLPSDVSATFVDLIPEIRTLGVSSFMEQMKTQKAILEQYIEGAAGFATMDEDTNYEAAEKSLKQALHQLTHLQRVWQDVLPASVYRKAIGILLNSLLTLVMDHLTSLEDISSEAARKLFLLLKMVDDKAATLFLTEEESSDTKNSGNKAKVDLHRHATKYTKFTEIQLVLNGSLQEIADRWADGMGPLAAEFPANELKQLIRALFQNTDRRAAVLAKIK
ncbi:centromere/kinetochore protein zw10 homolog isoform X2 [Babylonia areolata]